MFNYLTGAEFWLKNELPTYWSEPDRNKVCRITKVNPKPHGEYANVTKLFSVPDGFKMSSVSAC